MKVVKENKMEEKLKPDVIICDCHSTEHQMIVYYEEEDDMSEVRYPMCYLHIHLNERNFWGRLKYGIKYILGYKSRFGAFDEFIISIENIDKFEKIVNHIKECKLRG